MPSLARSMSESRTLTIFYDGYCPLCMAEMKHLKKRDKQQTLNFVDIQHPNFVQDYPDLNWHNLNSRIHGYLDDGRLISGLDVTYLAWKLVGKGWVYAPLRWPVIRWFADHVYTMFAKHRYTISYWLTGKKRCVPCEATNQAQTENHQRQANKPATSSKVKS